ncbi:M23 family metallopeptidase [Arthrobacter sp. IA7]|uniref:M23 family metallopeptidase n=1 Tax=Arthrobacter ipis TaxID=2716202 RepID=UPI001682C149|nr:M23 family metallopeptidase [Arthrobacter ipis]MBD1543458.1 M23 family metallopeptidase [Arthrobacter ipis]
MRAHAMAALLLLTTAAAPPSVAPAPSALPPVSPARATAPAPAGWSWPLAPRPAVLRPFDPPDKPWLSGHRGVDLGSASDGGPVTAPESGTVSFVGVVVDRPVLTIDHGNGLRSSFEPVRSTLKKGASVAKGAVVGTLLAGHCGSSPCVHWGVRRGEEYLNPLSFILDLRPSVLLPLN